MQWTRGIVESLATIYSVRRLRCGLSRQRVFNQKQNKQAELILNILDIERQMFSPLRGREASKDDHGEKLYLAMRRKMHSVLPENVLESYLEDLRQAQLEGRNLIAEKFDRREGKLPPLKVNPLIPQIVDLECAWKQAVDQKTPYHNVARSEDAFRLYVTSELETYSDRTLELYYSAVREALRARRNLVEERYRNPTNTKPHGTKKKKRKFGLKRAA